MADHSESTPVDEAETRRKLTILVNAGPTREYFDSVRFISNASTGKQGYAIAQAAVERGHEVILVSGPVALRPVEGARMVHVTTAEEMARACKAEFGHADVAILTAAVSDYRPRQAESKKIEKSSEPLHVTLVPTIDISAELGAIKGRRLVVGFAMDDHEGKSKAEAKLQRKRCDIIVQNGPANVAADRASVRIFSAQDGWGERIAGTKLEVARRLLSILETADLRHRARGAAEHKELR